MPIIYHEGYSLGGSSDANQLLKDTVGWIGKNLLKNTATSGSNQGITYTVNSDKSVTINGTNTDSAQHSVMVGIVTLDAGDYKVNGLKNNGGYTSFWINLYNLTDNSNIKDVRNANEDVTFTLSAPKQVRVNVYWAGNATVSNITIYPMIRKADITDPTYEPYHESVETMYEEEIHGVNLIPYPYWDKTVTKNGITFTMNSDGSVTANGTATGVANYNILVGNGYGYAKNKYIGCIYTALTTQGSNSTYRIIADYSETGTSWKAGDESFNIGEGLVIRNYPYVQIHLYISSGATVNNLVFKPMLRKADIEDSTYRPYNSQAIQNQLNAQGVLGAKNLLENTATSRTVNGVTFTVNSDGSVVLNGTATAEATFNFMPARKELVQGETYIISGCPSDAEFNTYDMARNLAETASGTNVEGMSSTGDVTFSVSNKKWFLAYIRVRSGVTVSNKVFKPMLRLASDPDDTYQPYAMTNRELTEKKINIADLKRVVSASSDFTDFKTRIASL